MERILILMAAPVFDEAEAALADAVAKAGGPRRITIGLCLSEEPDQDALRRMRALPGIQYLAPWDDPWTGMPPLWQGEGFALIADPALRFAPKWDMELLRAWRRSPASDCMRCVLTGFPPDPSDPVDAVAPVALDRFQADGSLVFKKGMPIRYAGMPLPSAFLHPGFCFGPAGFFNAMAGEPTPRFLAAHRLGWRLMTLHRPAVRSIREMPVPGCGLPDSLAGCEDFQRDFAVDLINHTVSARARTGLFSVDLSYPMKTPVAVRFQEMLRARAAGRGTAVPMMVTAMIDGLESRDQLPEETMHSFAMLCAVKSIPLLCFADGAHMRRVAPLLANILEYKPRYGLRLPKDNNNNNRPAGSQELSKIFLLAQAREKFLSHTHYGWLDPDVLRWPVSERAALQWDTICQDRVVLATVDSIPDPSAVIVPEQYVLPLCSAISELCGIELWEKGVLPDEISLWQTLMQLHPEWFNAVALPEKRRLLTLTMAGRGEEFHTV